MQNGKRLRHGSRSILVGLLLLLALSSASLWGASPLEELQQILKDYVLITSNLNSNYDSLDRRLNISEQSISLISKDIMTLQENSKTRDEILKKHEDSLTKVEQKSASSEKIIKDLQTGWSNMEDSLKTSRAINNVLIGVGIVSIALNVLLMLTR